MGYVKVIIHSLWFDNPLLCVATSRTNQVGYIIQPCSTASWADQVGYIANTYHCALGSWGGYRQ